MIYYFTIYLIYLCPSHHFQFFLFFFFNDTATTEIYTLSLHDALPISQPAPNGRENKPWVNRWQLAALHEVQRVMTDVDPVQSGYVVCAMFVMAQTERPSRFVTDAAERVQRVRMFRMQTALGCGSSYDE